MSRPIHIDAWFDVICPWCLIGKRQLERAIALWREAQPQQEVRVRWHGVQLLKDLPAPGLPFDAFYVQRLGSQAAVRARQQQVLAAAQAAGVSIDFSRIAAMPNTARAHQLLSAVAEQLPACHEALLEALYQAHFNQGRHVGDLDTLLMLAAGQGIPDAWLADWQRQPQPPVYLSDSLAAANGVPAFVLDQSLSVVGAQSPEVFLQAFRRLRPQCEVMA